MKTFLLIPSFFPCYCSVLLDIIHNKYWFCSFHKHGENRIKFVVFCIVEFTVNLTTRHVEIHCKYSPRKHHKSDKSTIKFHQIYYCISPDCQVSFTRPSSEIHQTIKWSSPDHKWISPDCQVNFTRPSSEIHQIFRWTPPGLESPHFVVKHVVRYVVYLLWWNSLCTFHSVQFSNM